MLSLCAQRSSIFEASKITVEMYQNSALSDKASGLQDYSTNTHARMTVVLTGASFLHVYSAVDQA